jgi:hypothetical protein
LAGWLNGSRGRMKSGPARFLSSQYHDDLRVGRLGSVLLPSEMMTGAQGCYSASMSRTNPAKRVRHPVASNLRKSCEEKPWEPAKPRSFTWQLAPIAGPLARCIAREPALKAPELTVETADKARGERGQPACRCFSSGTRTRARVNLSREQTEELRTLAAQRPTGRRTLVWGPVVFLLACLSLAYAGWIAAGGVGGLDYCDVFAR